MALISCPECGREKVSDSAEYCPECGFGIKAHFEEIRLAEEREIAKKKREAEKKKQEEERQEQARIRERQEMLDKMREIWVPEHKPFFNKLIAMGLLLTIPFGMLVLLTVLDGDASSGGWFFSTIGLLIGFILIGGGISELKEERELYDRYAWDRERYIQELVLLQDKRAKEQAEAERERIHRKHMRENPYDIKCPVCASVNVKRISTTSKVVSVGAVGLASGKIGKQYKCNACGHMW